MRKLLLKNTLLLLFSAVAVSCASRSESYVTVDGMMLGTSYHLSAKCAAPSGELYSAMSRIDAEAKASMSIFDPSSLISRINSNLTDSLDEHLVANIRLADSVSRLSGGMYDITVKPLVEAWGFVRKEQQVSTPNVDSLLNFVGYQKISIEGNRLIKSDKRMQIDLNSIAKGYVVDMASRMLEERGAENYIVEIGGEIRCRGLNSRGTKWVVGIDSPFDGNMSPGESLQVCIGLSDESLATSGNYRRYRVDSEGNKIAHTINPVTGCSSVSRLLSATVICEECAMADALCTMFMALGDERAIELARSLDSLAVYFILDAGGADYEVFMTPAMESKIIK